MTRLLVIALLLASAAPAAAQRRERRGAPAEEVDHFDWRNASGQAATADHRAAMKVADREALRVLDIYACGHFPPRALEAPLRNYRRAIAADPRQPEPHYRAAMLIHCAYLDRTRDWVYSLSERRWAEQLLDHLATFERLAPHDPRLGDITNSLYPGSFYFERALVHTKLAATRDTEEAQAAQYRLAIADYERAVAVLRDADLDPATRTAALNTPLGNMAEICMIIGDLERSRRVYAEAVANRQEFTTAVGYAVALDRDGQAWKAREIVRDNARTGVLADYVDKLKKGDVFYVPTGEVHYYFGLIHDALGNDAIAISEFRKFIASGAHPRFHARARANIDDAMKRLKAGGRRPAQDLSWWREWPDR